MKAVLLKQYDIDPTKALELTEYPLPEPGKDEVLVKIYAASLNPIDARIRSGYGRAIIAEKAALPIVLGRDFSGEIVKTSDNVTDYIVGDAVFGIVNPFSAAGMKQGSHAEFVCVPVNDIVKKPANVDHTQAAALPYVALTTYSALISQTGMSLEDYANKQVFVHAGSGGVGSYTIQFLKALGACVTTTCSTANVDFAYKLGADKIIDYTKNDYAKNTTRYDIAYDLLGKSHTNHTLGLLKSSPSSNSTVSRIETLLQTCLNQLETANETWNMQMYKKILKHFDAELSTLLPNPTKYISIVGPMMPLTDEKGLHIGMQQFVADTLKQKASQAQEHGRCFSYSFFEPNIIALKLLAKHIATTTIKSYVDKTFSLTEAALAHQSIETGRTKGKIVFYMN